MENYYKLTGVNVGAGWIDQIRDRMFPTTQPQQQDGEQTIDKS